MIEADVDFHTVAFPDFPAGWQRPIDLAEGFMTAAWLTFDWQRKANPNLRFEIPSSMRGGIYHSTFPGLPPSFQYDPLGSLLEHGGQIGEATSARDVGTEQAAEGERIGRLPLLWLVWKFVDLVALQWASRGRDHTNLAEKYLTLHQVGGPDLGGYGTALFHAAFGRRWLDPSDATELTQIEEQYILGERLSGSFHPSGSAYVPSIWLTAFSLVTFWYPNEPGFELRGKSWDWRLLPTVEQLLERGADLGLAGAPNQWPGWPN